MHNLELADRYPDPLDGLDPIDRATYLLDALAYVADNARDADGRAERAAAAEGRAYVLDHVAHGLAATLDALTSDLADAAAAALATLDREGAA